MTKSKIHSTLKNRNSLLARNTYLLFIIPFVLIGVFLIVSSLAATSIATIEPENSSLLNVTSVTDTNASGGKAIKFGVAGGSGGARTCPAYPLFPTTTCTGVPAGYATTTINGDLSTSANGQIIDGKIITGNLRINHSNVTVTNSRIMGQVYNYASNNLVLKDSDIGPDSCPNSASDYNSIDGSNYSLIRTHVHNNGADLVRLGGSGSVLIEDSILDRTCFYPGDHLDAIQFYSPGSVANVTIKHSKIDVRPENTSGNYGNSAIFWADNPGNGSTLTVTQSSLAGGGFTVALYDAVAGSRIVLDVNNSTFVKNSYQYGICSSSNSIAFDGSTGVKFTNNKYDDGSATGGC